MIGHRFQYTKLASQSSHIAVEHPSRPTDLDGAVALLVAPDFTGHGYAILAATPGRDDWLVGMVGFEDLPTPRVLGFVETYRHRDEAVEGWKVLSCVTTLTGVLIGHLADVMQVLLPDRHPVLSAGLGDAKVLPFQIPRRHRGLWRTDDWAETEP